ncbi:MAG: hypothetical protein ACXVSL_10740, partial [Solirubrobacteraceae bacterium]
MLKRFGESVKRRTSSAHSGRGPEAAGGKWLGPGQRGAVAHEEVEQRIEELTGEIDGYEPAIVSSAGALVRALEALELRKVAILTP